MTDQADTVCLSDIAQIIPGTSPSGRDINDMGEGLPFFQGSKEFGTRYPRPERFTTAPVKTAAAGDILLSVRAPVGRVNIADTACAIGRGVMAVRPRDPDDAPYIAAFLQMMGETWDAHATDGTMFANLSKVGLEQLPVRWPLMRHKIADVIEALDDRIESAARLEEVLGQAVLAEYAVALLDRSAEKLISLVDAVSLINGGAYTNGADGTGRMVIRIKELNSGPSESTVYSSITVPNNKTAYPGDVLFAWSGSLGVWRWYRDEAIVNQHIFKVLPNKHPIWLGWIHILGELERFQDIAAGKATTMGHITKDHLERTTVPTFSTEELEELSARVEPLWGAQLQAGRELQTLQAVRAKLLPALVSGELRVAAAEELVEATT